MKYNIRNQKSNLDIVDDKSQRAMYFNQWEQQLQTLLEGKNINSIAVFLDRNMIDEDFRYFLISKLSYIQSFYPELYGEILEIVQNKNSDLKGKIRE